MVLSYHDIRTVLPVSGKYCLNRGKNDVSPLFQIASLHV